MKGLMVIATCLTLVAGAVYCSTSLTTFPTKSMPATGYPAGEWAALFAKAYMEHAGKQADHMPIG